MSQKISGDAPQAEQLNGVIREQLEAMYGQHDPLTEIRERALCSMTTSTELRKRGQSVAAAVGIKMPNFPEVPRRGDLDLRKLIKNVYTFSKYVSTFSTLITLWLTLATAL